MGSLDMYSELPDYKAKLSIDLQDFINTHWELLKSDSFQTLKFNVLSTPRQRRICTMCFSTVTETSPLLIPTSPSVDTPKYSSAYLFVFIAAFLQAIRATLIHTTLTQSSVSIGGTLFVFGIVFLPSSLIILLLDPNASFNIFLDASLLQLLLLRAIFSGLVFYANAVALSLLPVGVAVTLFGTTPCITTILAYLILGEKINKRDIIAIFLNLFGVFLVAHPANTSEKLSLLGLAYGLFSATFMATCLIVVRAMGTQVHFAHNLFSIGIGCLGLLPFIGGVNEIYELWNQTVPSVVSVIVAAMAAFFSQALINNAMRIRACKPGKAAAVLTMNVPLSFFMGVVFIGEQPDLSSMAGSVLVISSVMYIAVCGKRGL